MGFRQKFARSSALSLGLRDISLLCSCFRVVRDKTAKLAVEFFTAAFKAFHLVSLGLSASIDIQRLGMGRGSLVFELSAFMRTEFLA